MGWFSRRRGPFELTDDDLDLIAEVLPHSLDLDDAERARLLELTVTAIDGLRWEAAAGIELTDEIRIVIACHAAYLGLGLSDDAVLSARSIIVSPDDIRLSGEHEYVDGIVTDGDTWVSGLSDESGPLMISWDAFVEDIEHAGDGRNVVFHEFAHRIDMLDGISDGVPPLPDAEARSRWISVCEAAYERAAIGEGGASLDEYAGVAPNEFFAVATESFFDAPRVLADEHPDLYRVLADFYRQDPAAREARAIDSSS